ncbi:MAG: Peptidase M23 [Chloroflexi bacterium OLB15]|nr:MAG: Peptidase M23 [Chloroflexi bacterium OLB15]
MTAVQTTRRRTSTVRREPVKKKAAAKGKIANKRSFRIPFAYTLKQIAFFSVLFIALPAAVYLTAPTWEMQVVAAVANTPLSSMTYSGQIAPLFTPEVQRWGSDIARWASVHQLDPNLLATVMQIESCGDDDVSSSAGAQGLFQVMPFHFTSGEVMTDPETNARRGADFLAFCMDYANNDSNLAMACYNGGPSVVHRNISTWANETQRYYRWGSTIYSDARQNLSQSEALNTWLNAGGSGLCAIARQDV